MFTGLSLDRCVCVRVCVCVRRGVIGYMKVPINMCKSLNTEAIWCPGVSLGVVCH